MGLNKYKVSVVMAVYNGGRYLNEAISSILDQTFRDFEFIIVDDGSTDGTKEIIEAFQSADSRVRLIARENRGQTRSLNEAIWCSTGEYIARMDADDISLPNRLEKQVLLLDGNPEVGMCGAWIRMFDDKIGFLQDYQYPVSNDSIRRGILFHCPFAHPSVMVRSSVVKHVGAYDTSIRFAQDYELWTRIVFRYRTENIPEVLLHYRVHSGQMTKGYNFGMRLEGVKIRLFVLLKWVRYLVIKGW